VQGESSALETRRHSNLQMFPATTCNQVSTPGMAQLVSNDIDVLTITADDCGCCEGVDGVFHACATGLISQIL
jgi:hypothetical protein